MTEPLFLKEFAIKYHYDEEQNETLARVARKMQECILADIRDGKAVWNAGNIAQDAGGSAAGGGVDGRCPESVAADGGVDAQTPGMCCPVCITLGSGVDCLQDRYLEEKLLTEAYMIETLGSELLLKAYPQWNAWVASGDKYLVRRYHFLGSSPEYPITDLPALLEKLQMPVVCTEAYCMIPKKSVAFYAELVDAHTAGITECEGICAGCGRKDCENRMEKMSSGNYVADMTDRPFTYGYQRIFGIR